MLNKMNLNNTLPKDKKKTKQRNIFKKKGKNQSKQQSIPRGNY